ncbi:MAG: MMPL family transporter, partial [Oligoflexia bacterium]|nr:MMPL family transporter [Oligoflexia bacterium]
TDTGRKRDRVDALLSFCTGLSATVRGRRGVYLGSLLVAIVAAVGISQVRVYHDPLTWLPSDDPTPRSVRILDQKVGGISSVSVVIDAPGELGVTDRDVLVAMEGLEKHVRAFRHPRTGEHIVGNSTSLLGIVKEVNRALHQGDPAAYVIPPDQRGVSDDLLLFESASPRDLHRVATTDLKKTHISFRLDWMDATSLLPLADYLQDSINQYMGDLIAAGRVKVIVTGSAYSLVSTVGTLLLDMIRSFGVAVGIIAVMMAMLLRSLRLAVVALIPNVLPVAMILGFMGVAGIPIDLATLLIASIVIGIAVDSTIHYLHQFRVAYLQDQDVNLAISHALEHAGRAIVSTTVILSIGFGAYLASQLLNIQRFGVLVAAACGFSLFSNLILVPALLRTIYRGDHAAS